MTQPMAERLDRYFALSERGTSTRTQTLAGCATFLTAWKANVLDMESAAVAQVAYANNVPVIVFRSLSDLAGGDAGENQMNTFMTLASASSADVVQAFVAALPDQVHRCVTLPEPEGGMPQACSSSLSRAIFSRQTSGAV